MDFDRELDVSAEPFLDRLDLGVVCVRKQRAERVLGGIEHNESL